MTTEAMVDYLLGLLDGSTSISNEGVGLVIAKLHAAEELAKTLGYYDSPFMNRELKEALANYRAAGGCSAEASLSSQQAAPGGGE